MQIVRAATESSDIEAPASFAQHLWGVQRIPAYIIDDVIVESGDEQMIIRFRVRICPITDFTVYRRRAIVESMYASSVI